MASIFTIMVIIAVFTTGMASPLYHWLSRGLVLEGARIPGTRKPLSDSPPLPIAIQSVPDGGSQCSVSRKREVGAHARNDRREVPMMRVATAWAVLLGVSGCMGVHEDLGAGSADPSLSALSAADSGTKSDDEAATPAPGLPANCTQEAQAAGTDDVYSRCVTRAKTCYEYEPDTRICEAHMRGCDTLLTTKPTAPPPPAADDAYTVCVRKAKECYNGANDPADCDANWKICDALKKAPDPAEVEAQRQADYAGCLDKAKLCYGYEKNTKICDEQRASCELVFAADPG